jgi:hypothetical protein
MRAIVVVLICILQTLALIGCDRNKGPSPEIGRDLTHVVRYHGETLGAISAWYTGSVNNWQKILKFNPKLDVRRVQLGDRIIIPNTLLTRRDSLPQKFLQSAVPAQQPRKKTRNGTATQQTNSEQTSVVVPSPTPVATSVENIVPAATPVLETVVPEEFVPEATVAEVIATATPAPETQALPEPTPEEITQIQTIPEATPTPSTAAAKTREELWEELMEE